MKYTLVLFITNCLFFILPANVFGQFNIEYPDQLSQLKVGTTYIAMKDLESTISKEYIEIFKEYWTISKIEFIKYTEYADYLSPGNFFLTISGFEKTKQWVTNYNNGGVKRSSEWTNTYIFLDLWTSNDVYFKKKAKNPKWQFSNQYKIQIARVDLFPDFPTVKDPESLYLYDYDGEGHLRNWGKGILKNYIQILMAEFDKGERRKLFKYVADKEKLQTLHEQDLYIPDYVMIEFDKWTGDESEKHEEEELFKYFESSYKLLSIEDLNDKILNDPNPFYYLIYIKSSTQKYLNVINSQTGEIIYAEYSAVSYNIDSKDFKHLSKLINN